MTSCPLRARLLALLRPHPYSTRRTALPPSPSPLLILLLLVPRLLFSSSSSFLLLLVLCFPSSHAPACSRGLGLAGTGCLLLALLLLGVCAGEHQAVQQRGQSAGLRVCASVCVCVCVRVYMYVCVCVCFKEHKKMQCKDARAQRQPGRQRSGRGRRATVVRGRGSVAGVLMSLIMLHWADGRARIV